MSIELFEFQCLFFLRIRAYHLSSVGWESIEGIFVVVTKIKQTVNVSVIFPISLFETSQNRICQPFIIQSWPSRNCANLLMC